MTGFLARRSFASTGSLLGFFIFKGSWRSQKAIKDMDTIFQLHWIRTEELFLHSAITIKL